MKIYQVITRRDGATQVESNCYYHKREDAEQVLNHLYEEEEKSNKYAEDYSHDGYVHLFNAKTLDEFCAEIIETGISIYDCAEEYWKQFIRGYVETSEHYQDMSEEVVDEIVDEVYDNVINDDYMFQQIDESVQQQVYDNKTFKKYEYGED